MYPQLLVYTYDIALLFFVFFFVLCRSLSFAGNFWGGVFFVCSLKDLRHPSGCLQ